MIECRSSFDDYTSFAMGDFQDEAFKTKLGITKIQQSNNLLEEYKLSKPIEVYGYTTQSIVFNASGVMAVLDESNSQKIAEKLNLKIILNSNGKILATKTISETAPKMIASMKVWKKISKDLSTVPSHPNKTLIGCTYKPMMQ